ncbi:FAD-dependent oxidoreductase [Planosporangium thailandense]|uniref:FAD-dependent oxidoreductase n=1 Tax=Planosporangium thailandense TaxID=765197 RepID=A0ABX0Y3T8_9ACTN|nr:FAD-dependent oxidoreductase [Planosporangium thailandense]NJC73052.1 FAD-dependent oxidoreductase [Planosporangium thailandense]
MSRDGLLIVGASQAGVQLAVSLRALGHDGPITLVGEENHRPYQRPALSKEFLQGLISKESLIFRSEAYWAEHRIRVVKNERIVQIGKSDDGSGTAYAESGAAFDFERLALTVGARARRLEIPGADLAGVLYLRNADDALELKARAPEAGDVVVIGGGFIGLEAAASLTKMGKRVTVLEAGPRLVGRAVGPEMSEYLRAYHAERGIEIVLDAQVTRLVPADSGAAVGGVQLADGRVVPADIVLIGIGVVPNTELASTLGLECDDGIRVDRYALTSDGVTIAVGDCANLPNPVPGAPPGDRIRFESVNNAVEQAKVAAYAITGRKEEYAGIPWFWSNQGALKLQIAGLSRGYDRTVVRRDDTRGKFSVLYYRGDRILAADCVNAPLDFMAVKAALADGSVIPYEQAADPTVPLKKITVAADAPRETRNELT